MQARRPGVRLTSAFAVMLLTMAAVAVVSPAGASASTCQSWVGPQPPSPGSASNELNAVTVISPCDAWVVGASSSSGKQQNLIEHWNGGSWHVVPSPQPGTGGSFLDGVRAVSASNIWAVGAYYNTAGDIDLILHWNGHTWKQVASPSPGFSPRLTAVRAVSANDAWAVGTSISKTRDVSRSIILHWNGHRWAQTKSPNPGAENNLFSVAATSASNAWAVGVSIKNNRDRTLILHWDGRRWTQVKSPNPGIRGIFLGSVAATSAHNAWAVGEFANSSGRDRTLILAWNGRAWAQVASPDPGPSKGGDVLEGVAMTSSSDGWAVGSSSNSDDTRENVLILHWNGRNWAAQATPGPGIRDELFAVSASSSSNVWAVGDFSDGGVFQNLALHCC
jgi:hypothetical protein